MAQTTKNNKTKQNKQQTKKFVQEKNQKKKTTKKSSSCCCWFLGIMFLIAAITGLIIYDTQTNGDGVFEKSATGKFLKNAGLLPYVETAWYKTMSCSARAYKWSEKNLPIYYTTVCTFSKPYIQLGCDLFKMMKGFLGNIFEICKTFIDQKSPIVYEFVEQYVPGLCRKIHSVFAAVFSATIDMYNGGCYFFKTKVFVGSLSPESLGKAFNQTQITAAKYYRWFNAKVDVYAEIK